MRTQLLSVADADITALGQGQIMNQADQGQNTSQADSLIDPLILVLAFLVLLEFAVLVVIAFRHRGTPPLRSSTRHIMLLRLGLPREFLG